MLSLYDIIPLFKQGFRFVISLYINLLASLTYNIEESHNIRNNNHERHLKSSFLQYFTQILYFVTKTTQALVFHFS